MNKIPVFRPLIDDSEKNRIEEALSDGWLGMGKLVGEFEEKIADFLGIEDKHVVCVSTGHAALHLALILCEVSVGDEVIVASFNNIADFQAILAVGATPVFCDVLDSTLCIDPDAIEGLISEKTKAIIVMDYDCCLADHERISKIATDANLRVIHDAAHSFGSKYQGMNVGNFSDITMFSFDPVKTITSIDGGALVVRSLEEKKMLHELRLIGMTQPAEVMYRNERAWTYDVERLGFRYHLSNIHAAMGLAQLEKIDLIRKSRVQACKYYSSRFRKISQVRVPESDFEDVVPFLYYIRVPSSIRSEFRNFLSKAGVDTGIHWQAGHTFTIFANCKKGDLTVTEQVESQVVSLPLHSDMKMEDLEIVCNAVEDFFRTGD
jgi:dTDP-4-amino-4,6-dideoxygalactose transaminase